MLAALLARQWWYALPATTDIISRQAAQLASALARPTNTKTAGITHATLALFHVATATAPPIPLAPTACLLSTISTISQGGTALRPAPQSAMSLPAPTASPAMSLAKLATASVLLNAPPATRATTFPPGTAGTCARTGLTPTQPICSA